MDAIDDQRLADLMREHLHDHPTQVAGCAVCKVALEHVITWLSAPDET